MLWIFCYTGRLTIVANLQFWYRYTCILFCVVLLKLIHRIINGVPRDFNENAAALQQQFLPAVCAMLQSLFQLLPSGSGADPGVGDLFQQCF